MPAFYSTSCPSIQLNLDQIVTGLFNLSHSSEDQGLPSDAHIGLTWNDIEHQIIEQSMYTVNTQLDLGHKKNRFTLRGLSKDSIHQQTEEWRKLANHAYQPKDLDDFKRNVSGIYYMKSNLY